MRFFVPLRLAGINFITLTCRTSNLIYGIVCSLCGLIYVGETKGQFNKRISGHRFQINDNGGQLLYRHFNQPNHSIVSMRVVIIEQIYHPTNSPTLSTHFRRQREEFWIKTLGTASPYGCNDNISRLQATNSSARPDVSIEKSQGFQTVRCLIGC